MRIGAIVVYAQHRYGSCRCSHSVEARVTDGVDLSSRAPQPLRIHVVNFIVFAVVHAALPPHNDTPSPRNGPPPRRTDLGCVAEFECGART